MGYLFFLYCLLRPQPCALAVYLAEYFVAAYHRQQRGGLHGGSYVTTIARFLGIMPESDQLLSPAIPSTTLGRASVSSMRLTHMFDRIGLWFRKHDYLLFDPEVLPEVIPVVIELRDGVLAPPTVQAVARQAQLEALGLAQPEDQAKPPPPADHVVDDEIPPPP
ncbi:hypothetical protein HanRHA438_Chr06g0265971 [Helianthus annuus]|nr:hypothetical protein HanRHA438_Chr06g0265971 [Helianthus annuus]